MWQHVAISQHANLSWVCSPTQPTNPPASPRPACPLQVRQAVIALRDEAREVEGAPRVPDVLDLQRLQELSPPEAAAAAVKLLAGTAIKLAGRL